MLSDPIAGVAVGSAVAVGVALGTGVAVAVGGVVGVEVAVDTLVGVGGRGVLVGAAVGSTGCP